MISPEGLAISPLMPASWRSWAVEPLAPESAIMKMLLKDLFWSISRSVILPSFSSTTPSSFIISSATFSVTLAQMSMTLL